MNGQDKWSELRRPSQGRNLRLVSEEDAWEPSETALERHAAAEDAEALRHRQRAEDLRRQAEVARRVRLEASLEKYQQLISRLTRLPRAWDGQHAETPSVEAAHTAWSILAAGLLTKMEPSRVDPSVEGGIVLEYHGEGKRYCLFECYNGGGSAVFLYSLGDGSPHATEVDFGTSTSRNLWSRIDQFRRGEIHSVDLE